MKSSQLIDKLSKDVPKVRRRSPLTMAIAALIVAFAIFIVEMAFSDIRGDLKQVTASGFLPVMAVLFLIAGFCLVSSLVLLATPGRNDYKIFGRLSAFTVCLLALGLLTRALMGHAPLSEGLVLSSGAQCTLSAIGLALLPTIVLMLGVRSLAPTRLRLAGLVVGLTGGIMASGFVQVCCPINHPIHLLSWHILIPLVVMGALTTGVSHWVLRW